MQQESQPVSINTSAMRYAVGLLAGLLLVYIEPALANKFETIGGGFSGSSGIKREWLQKFFLVLGGMSLFGAVLSLVVPHKNALYLNFNNWKQSAIVLFVLAAVFFALAGFI